MPLAHPSNGTDSPRPSDAVVDLLSSPRSYQERTGEVVQLETHISWVFLTSRFAYKLKKPVRFDFLDFSTLAKRHWACQREIELNRRLAQDVYLGLVPITKETKGQLKLGGAGEPVDWVVKMRRLPADRALDQLILGGSVSTSDATGLAARLAKFYQHLPPLSINAEVYRQRIEDHIRGNEVELAKPEYEFNQTTLKRIHTAQMRLLRLAPETLDARVCDGRIVDGHGDLRPEHIYFVPHPTIIDCIEFNDEFRQIDVLDELAFLAAECEHLGAVQVGDRIIDEYRATSRDFFPKSLLEFYKCYRACVRAKVLLLRGIQVEEQVREQYWDDARRYLQLADHHASKLAPPVLIVVFGLSGTGKTTLSRRIAERLDIEFCLVPMKSVWNCLHLAGTTATTNDCTIRPIADRSMKSCSAGLRVGLAINYPSFWTVRFTRQSSVSKPLKWPAWPAPRLAFYIANALPKRPSSALRRGN